MSRTSRGETETERELGGALGVPAHHLFAIGVDAGAKDLVRAMRRHPRNHWPDVHAVREVPAGATAPSAVAAWVQVESAAVDRAVAVREVLDLADDLAIVPAGFVPLDVVADPSAAWFEEQLGAWASAREVDADAVMPRALASLAGVTAVERLLRRVSDPTLRPDLRSAAAGAVGVVVLNTPGLDAAQLVAEHVAFACATGSPADDLRTATILDGLRPAASLAARRVRDHLPSLAWHDLLALDGPVSEATARLFAATSLAPSTAVAVRLQDLLDRGADEVRAAALEALAVAHPSATLLRDVAGMLIEGAPPVLRRAAVRVQCGHLGDIARPGWRALANSTDPADLAVVEEVLARHGTHRDVPEALELAHRMLRRRLLRDGAPPLGARLLVFLARHRGQVDVDALFIEVDARWERLPADVRAHLAVRGLP